MNKLSSAQNEKALRITRGADQVLVCDRCRVAESFYSRFVGLMGTLEMSEGEGLLITRCREIHMWWMKISIDAVFVKAVECESGVQVKHLKAFEVVKLVPNLRPWRILPVGARGATDTLELPAGTIVRTGMQRGDILCIN